MEITYASICKKLGCRPCDVKREFSGTEDDSKPSAFRVLTLEESNFLLDYYIQHGTLEPVKEDDSAQK